MEVLRTLRQMAGMGVGELAVEAGLSRQHVWRLENGEVRASVDTVRLLAAALAARLGVADAAVLHALLTGKVEWVPPRQVRPVRYLNLREAARYVGVSQEHLRNAIRQGHVRPRAIPGPRGQILISIEELDHYAQKHLEVAHGDEHLETV